MGGAALPVAADNADVADVLARLVATVDGLRDIVDPVLDQPEPDPLSTVARHERNVAHHAALEEVVHVLHARAPEHVGTVRDYLRRAAERERHPYGPLTAGPMF